MLIYFKISWFGERVIGLTLNSKKNIIFIHIIIVKKYSKQSRTLSGIINKSDTKEKNIVIKDNFSTKVDPIEEAYQYQQID